MISPRSNQPGANDRERESLRARGKIAALDDNEAELRTTIARVREDELHHRDVAVAHGARQTPGFRLLSAAIKAGCRVAIAVSERV